MKIICIKSKKSHPKMKGLNSGFQQAGSASNFFLLGPENQV
jgi:hypothetical protein